MRIPKRSAAAAIARPIAENARRYHARPLRTPTEVRRAVRYVRENHRKHMAQIGQSLPRAWVDPYASEGAGIALPKPHTWLLRTGASPP